MSLTEAGRRLHVLAREQLLGLRDFKRECAEERTQLTLAAGESIIQWVLLPGLARMPMPPNITLRLVNLSSAEIASGLADGTLDAGIVREDVPGKLEALALGTMNFCLFVPSPLLAARNPGALTARELRRLPLATLEGKGVFRTELERSARHKKVDLNIQLELPSFPLVAKAVQTGMYAGILPGLARGEFKADAVQEFQLPWLRPLSRKMVLAWNPRLARIRPPTSKILPLLKTACCLEAASHTDGNRSR